MFGYVKPFKPNLRMKEFDAYKGVYCALCKTLGRDYGITTRFILNYDFAFLALLYLSISSTCPSFERQRCLFNPLKKCVCCKDRREELSFAAASAVIMTYYKIKDHVEDSAFFSGLPARLTLPWANGKRKKAAKRYPELDEKMREYIESQRALEEAETPSIDWAAEPTAKLLSYLGSCLCGDERQKRVLERLCYFVGRWVYLIDAADDLEKDLKSGNYNPFLLSLKVTQFDQLPKARTYAQEVVQHTLSEAANAFDLLEAGRFSAILSNVLTKDCPPFCMIPFRKRWKVK